MKKYKFKKKEALKKINKLLNSKILEDKDKLNAIRFLIDNLK